MIGRALPGSIKKFMKLFNYNHLKQSVGGYLKIKSPGIFRLLTKHKIGVKYALSGGLGVLINLAVLYIFTEKIGIWYLTSSIIAFIISLLTGFFLQKFWTFRDNDFRRFKKTINHLRYSGRH